jgi:hypothetical protein
MGSRFLVVALLLSPVMAIGCDAPGKSQPAPIDVPATKPVEKSTQTTSKNTTDLPEEKPAKVIDSKKTPFNKKGTLLLETLPDGKRRVLVQTSVCYREGPLELLMCKYSSKEHESILHGDVDAQDIHTTLMVANATPGSPVSYKEQPDKTFKVIPPTGTKIKVLLQYEKKPGELVTVNAREWIRDVKTQKELAHDWVFAGSVLYKDPDDPTKKPTYLATGSGDYISVSNFSDSLLDLPIESTKDNSDLAFECWTDRIPALGTKVTMILEPVPDAKNDAKEKKEEKK